MMTWTTGGSRLKGDKPRTILVVTSSFPRISECMDSEAETVMQLRNELRDKEMKLTDIRLEALSSAHQLDQLREAMNRMQVRDQRWIAPGAAWERALESCSPTIQGLHTDCPLLSSLFVFFSHFHILLGAVFE
jgi:hypothetical protein